ncbi:hypothetical protein SUDANB105_03879 [Streptomyces sp. enrichment culture]
MVLAVPVGPTACAGSQETPRRTDSRWAEGIRWLKPTAAVIDVPPHDFAHLGLPEPEKFSTGMRYGYVCPGATEASQDPGAPAYDASASDEQCVRLYAHDYAPDRTRIYLRAHYEPGISPLPETSSAPPSTD